MEDTSIEGTPNKSLAKVQALRLTAKRDVQAFNYKYADLEQVWSILYKPLEDNNLVVIQAPQGLSLVTTVVHTTTGEKVASELSLMVSETSKNHMQDLGAALTYARRYALTAMFNIVVNDDDNLSNTKEEPTAKATTPASEKQLALAKDLLSKQGFDLEKIDARLALVKTTTDASSLINNLLKNKSSEVSHLNE